MGTSRGLPICALLAAIACGCGARTPDLADVPMLLDAGRYDEVEGRLEAFLRARPDDDRTHMLAAQVALGRPDQKPELALEHLSRVRLTDPPSLATVRLNQGKAHSALFDFAKAEAAWLDSLAIDPTVPESGWALLSLYYVEGRRDEARRLALRLHAREPDPRDRVRLLLELVRQDAQKPAPETQVDALEPAVRDHPDDLAASLGLGRALVRCSRADRGLEILRRAASDHARSLEAWDALLSGLDDAGAYDELAATLDRMPADLHLSPRLDRHRGRLAQERQDWTAAAGAYLRAWRHDPSDLTLTYRLGRAARLAGRLEEAARFEAKAGGMQAARDRILASYLEADSLKTLGVVPSPELYLRLGDLREEMGLRDEASAWYQFALKDRPGDRAILKLIDDMQGKSVD